MENNNKLPVSLTDIQNQITKLNDMLNEKYARLVEDVEHLEQEKAKFASTHKILMTFKDPIKLNIGGKIFMTSRSTLMKEDSMFKSMFSGRHELEKGEDGAYFIDRDPKYFGKILNFLRDGEFEMNDDEVERRELKREAEFYSLTALVHHLERSETKKIEFDPARKGPNVILNGATASCTTSWQSALTIAFSKGVHSFSMNWNGSYIMVGVTGASFNHMNTSGAYTQSYSMMLYNYNGRLHVAGEQIKTLSSFNSGSILTVELDCERRTVTWIIDAIRFTEPLHSNVQAPFTFCVDLNNSSATLVA